MTFRQSDCWFEILGNWPNCILYLETDKKINTTQANLQRRKVA